MITSQKFFGKILLATAAVVTFAAPVYAATTSTMPSRGLQQALAANDRKAIYDGAHRNGFNVASSFFSGRASGVDSKLGYANFGSRFDYMPELEGDQRVYALMLDGRYDFNSRAGRSSGFHPYLSGSLGMAMYGTNTTPASAVAMRGGDMVPLFRVGGGVSYHVSKQLNISLDYKAGFSSTLGDEFLTGRNQQQVGMHVLNMGMRYQF